MSDKRLATLRGYSISQRQEIAGLVSAIRLATADGEEKTVFLAYQLHNLYCALEDLFKRVAEAFENNVDDVSRFHRDLLRRMSFAVPGVRPRLLGATAWQLLDGLRRFRHLFRHAYTYRLEPLKITALQQEVLAAWDEVENDLDEFARFLEAAGGRGVREEEEQDV